MQFEEKMKQLADITKRLEQEQLSLEEASKLYAEGMKLSEECHTILENAVLTVQNIPVPQHGSGEEQ